MYPKSDYFVNALRSTAVFWATHGRLGTRNHFTLLRECKPFRLADREGLYWGRERATGDAPRPLPKGPKGRDRPAEQGFRQRVA